MFQSVPEFPLEVNEIPQKSTGYSSKVFLAKSQRKVKEDFSSEQNNKLPNSTKRQPSFAK